MGERIFYFWLRFRWLIVAGAFIVTIGAGALSGSFLQAGGESSTVNSDTVTPEEVIVVADGTSALASCDGIEKRDELFACRVALEGRAPIVLNVEGTGFLVDGAWQDAFGATTPLEVAGSAPDTLTRLAAGVSVDLDNDGFSEYVIASGERATLSVLSQKPGGGVRDTAKVRGLDAISNVNLILAFDANRDGWLDLVVSSIRAVDGQTGVSGQLRRGVDIFLNRGWESPGSFGQGEPVRNIPGANRTAAPVYASEHIADGYVGDIDGDGELDLTLIDRRGGALIHWGAETSDWGAELPTELRIPTGATGLDAGDIDGDGDVDLIVSYDVSLGSAFGNLCPVQLNGRPCSPPPGMSIYGGVAVFVQDTPRALILSETLSVLDLRNASDVIIADIDGDRAADIVVSRETLDGEGGVTVYSPVNVNGTITEFEAGAEIGTGAVSSLRAVDLDGNGMPDIAMTGRGSAKAQLWINSNEARRFLHLDLRGAGGLETVGTARSAIGVRITITDIDNQTLSMTSDLDHAGEGVLIHLPLTTGAWAGTEAVPRVEITFPLTGRTLTLTNVTTGERLTVDEPAK
jgi:hypothetical protein